MTREEALLLARKKKRAAEAKGRRLQYLARDYFVAQGVRVCVAWKLTHWIPAAGGKRFPIQVRHDFYGLWDLIVTYPDGARGFVQVTTLNNVAAKRTQIREDGFPTTARDMILGHEDGRAFRVLRGPGFATSPLTPGQRRALALLVNAREVWPGRRLQPWTTDAGKKIAQSIMAECVRREWVDPVRHRLTIAGAVILRQCESVEAPKRPKGGKRGRPSTKNVLGNAVALTVALAGSERAAANGRRAGA